MSHPQHIIEQFRSLGHVAGGEAYFPLDVARSLIQRCSDARVAIVGLEAFELGEEGQLRPRVDLIADFSGVIEATLPWERKVQQTAGDAMRFVQSIIRMAPDLVVNFVLKAPTDPWV